VSGCQNSAKRPERQDLRPLLEDYLGATIPGAADMTVELSEEAAKAGWSAETIIFDGDYLLDGTPVHLPLVLRRQVVGEEVTHDASLAMQARIMDALRTRTTLPVPGVIGMGDTDEPFGAPFIIMERMPGRIVPQLPNYHVEGWLADLPLAERSGVWERAIRAIAAVNKVDWRDGLQFLDNPAAGSAGLPQYIAWVEDWLRWVLGDRSHPVADAALAYIKQNAPAGAPANLVWGDPIPANLLFDDAGNVTGIIDWEFAALAPGELDLAWWLFFDNLFSAGFDLPPLAGLPDREQTIAIYESELGRPVSDLPYYELLVGLRMIIASMRSYDRVAAAGKVPPENQAWLKNPSSAWVAEQLGIGPVEVGADFLDFRTALFKRN
jgi:aminoglycoside phosphotransferase (APT) family kinase protein